MRGGGGTPARVLLVVALVAGAILRIGAAAGKTHLQHDEAITFLAATCHQGEYGRVVNDETRPYGVWVAVREWKRMLSVEHHFCFGQIAADLREDDIHPPLYFWLLHLWLLLTGAHLWSAPVLNTLLALAGGVVLYRLARRARFSPLVSSTAVALWMLSPGVLEVTAFSRHYELLALVSLLFVLTVQRFVQRAEGPAPIAKGPPLLLAGVTIVGFASHHYFAVLASGVTLFALLRLLRRSQRRASAALVAATGVGALVGMLIARPFYQMTRQQGQRQPFDVGALPERLGAVYRTVLEFFLHPRVYDALPSALVAVVATAALIGAFVLALRDRAPSPSRPDLALPTFLVAWTWGWTVLLYLLFVSPAHAMAPRYLVYTWPFFAMLLAHLALRLPRGRRLVVSGLLMGLLAVSTLRVGHFVQKRLALATSPVPLARADRVLSGATGRGIFPTYAVHMRNDTRIYVAHPEDLAAHPQSWLPQITEGTVYIPNARKPAPPEESEVLRALANLEHPVLRIGPSPLGDVEPISSER